jgi:hypothetical protein
VVLQRPLAFVQVASSTRVHVSVEYCPCVLGGGPTSSCVCAANQPFSIYSHTLSLFSLNLLVCSFSYGAERFEDGASQINKSDMFFGDDGELTDAQLEQLDEVTMKNVQFVKMTEGDVVLLDNYKTMHGRNVFDGTRKHGVAWFEGWEGEEEMKQSNSKVAAGAQTAKPPFFAK